MKDLFERHKDLKASIGAFMLAFFQFEFGLGILCTFTEFGLIRKDEQLPHYLGMNLDNKNQFLQKTEVNTSVRGGCQSVSGWKE